MVRTSPVLLLLLAVCAPLATGDLFGYKSLTDIARDLSPVEAGLYSYLHKCRLREHPEVALAQAFADKFVGQSDAIKAIVAAVKDWSDE